MNLLRGPCGPLRLPVILLLIGVVAAAQGVPLSVEEGAVPVTDHLAITAEAGWESGQIPDWFVAHGLTADLPWALQFGLGGVWGGFPDQGQTRLSSLDAAVRWQPWATSSAGFQVEGTGATILGKPLSIDYRGQVSGVSRVVSPRADGSSSVGAGLRGWVDLPGGFSLQGTARASSVWVGKGKRFDWADALRYEGSLVAGYRFGGPFSASVANRVIWWEGRGWTYEALPQAAVSLGSEWALAAGVGMPVVGAPVWRGVVTLQWVPPVKVTAVTTAATGAVSGSLASLGAVNWDFQVIPEGKNLRIRIYFTFLGDRADLFEPQNAQYGPQNRKLMQKLLEYIEKYPKARLQIEGHTNRANLKKTFEDEQKTEMIPLARNRGDAVAKALSAVGIDRKRMTTVAVGGAKPLAKFDDAENSWKNRRVEVVILLE